MLNGEGVTFLFYLLYARIRDLSGKNYNVLQVIQSKYIVIESFIFL